MALVSEKLMVSLNLGVGGSTLTETPTLARHHSNHLHELFYNRSSW